MKQLESEFYTIKEISTIYNIKDMTIRNWLRRGKLPYSKMGELVRIRKLDWDFFMAKPAKPE